MPRKKIFGKFWKPLHNELFSRESKYTKMAHYKQNYAKKIILSLKSNHYSKNSAAIVTCATNTFKHSKSKKNQFSLKTRSILGPSTMHAQVFLIQKPV